jgi:ABC-type nitrate/sulfonate/bicarbonate transport system substrate-binding protein
MRRLMTMVLILVGVVACGCAAPSSTPAPTPIPRKSGTIRFFDIANLDVRDVPMLMALASLEAQGYTVQKQYLATSPLIADALARGDADIGVINNQTMWTAINKGSRVRTILGSVAATVIVAAKQEIKVCHELDGRPVALPSTSGVNPALLSEYLKQNCAGTAPKYLVIPDTAGRDAALLSGQVDAATFQSEELFRIEKKAPGKFHLLISLSQAFPQIQVDGVQVRQAWAEQHPEIVRDFIRAVLTANRQVQETPAILYAESAKFLSLDPQSAKEIGDSYLQLKIWDANGSLTMNNVQYTIDFLTGIKSLPASLGAKDVADLSYLNDVLGEIGRK